MCRRPRARIVTDDPGGAGTARLAARVSPRRGVIVRTEAVGLAQAKAIEAQGIATAEGFEAQKEALGEGATALVNAIKAIAEGQIKVVPEVLVAGSGGSIEGLAASLIKLVRDRPALPVESSDAA
jgi:hypothetical protein